MSNENAMVVDNVDRQRAYVEAQKTKGPGLGVVFADAFLRGMRDLGYKNPAWALAEQLDNSFQAGADTVAIRLKISGDRKASSKPEQIAIIDNGNGMIPEMLSYAVRWGGTDREGDRTGFGRYGYGLPSSAVALAKRYTVYGKPLGGMWQSVTVDIEELAAAANDIKKTEEILTAKPAEIPAWIQDGAKEDDNLDVASLTSGVIIVLENPDRLHRMSGWMRADSLRTKLLQHFGVIYRHWLPERKVFVDGVVTQVVDPLFLMEHGRFYDETPVHAERIETRSFEVETAEGTKGKVTIRASVLPPNFQLVDPSSYATEGKRPKRNKRFEIMRDYNGLLVCRERRQIDTVTPRWTKFQNYDANIKIEIDFDAELDELFGLTTSKQQIDIDDTMWEKLQHNGSGGGALIDLVRDLRDRFEVLQRELTAKAENRNAIETARPSAVAMEESEKFKEASPAPSQTQSEEAQRNLDELASTRAEVSGVAKEKILDDLVQETRTRRWEVEFSSIPEGPFYRPKRLGEQKRLIINTDHPFYNKVYSVAAEARASLEVLLFVLAERELESRADAETFYKVERQRWSERLRHALDSLTSEDSLADKASVMAERMYIADDDATVAA